MPKPVSVLLQKEGKVCKHSTWKSESRRSQWVWGHPGLNSECQDSQSYTARPCLQKWINKKEGENWEVSQRIKALPVQVWPRNHCRRKRKNWFQKAVLWLPHVHCGGGTIHTCAHVHAHTRTHTKNKVESHRGRQHGTLTSTRSHMHVSVHTLTRTYICAYPHTIHIHAHTLKKHFKETKNPHLLLLTKL